MRCFVGRSCPFWEGVEQPIKNLSEVLLGVSRCWARNGPKSQSGQAENLPMPCRVRAKRSSCASEPDVATADAGAESRQIFVYARCGSLDVKIRRVVLSAAVAAVVAVLLVGRSSGKSRRCVSTPCRCLLTPAQRCGRDSLFQIMSGVVCRLSRLYAPVGRADRADRAANVHDGSRI